MLYLITQTNMLTRNGKYNLIPFYLIAITLLFSTMFATNGKFVESELLPKIYIFVGATALMVLVITYKSSVKIRTGFVPCIACCGMAYFAVRSSIFSSFWQLDIGIMSFIAFAMLYTCFNAMPLQGDGIFGKIVIVVCVAQSIYGIIQYIGLVPSHSTFPVVGSFDNPAGFAACLSAGFPLCLKKLPHDRHWQLWLTICGCLVIPTAIILSGSRAGMLSVAAAALIYLYAKHTRIQRLITATTILAAFGVLLAILVFARTDSSLGRLQIWEASFAMVCEHPLFGGGAGSFLAEYMPHQAAFFAADPSNGWRVLADNVVHPFNEYLLILIEYGMVGLLCLVVSALILMRNRGWATTQGLCMLSIGIFACFSYPLRYPFVWVIIAYSLATINIGKRVTIKMNWKLRVVAICASAVICGIVFRDANFEKEWCKLTRTWNTGNPDFTLERYNELYTRWNGNPLFLYNYGRVLSVLGQPDKSNEILVHCSKYLNDYDVQMAMGDNHLRLKEPDKALQCYGTASAMCPNRFLPMHRLMTLYAENGQFQKARTAAQQILAMPVKIPSPKVSQIKTSAAKHLSDQSRKNITP